MLGRRLVFAADEYYLLAGRPFPAAEAYEGFAMHEDGVGMARTFELEFPGDEVDGDRHRPRAGSSPGSTAPSAPRPTRAVPRRRGAPGSAARCGPRRPAPGRRSSPATTAPRCSAPLVGRLGRDDVRVVPVENQFFGGNIAVTGLMVGEDLARVLADEPEGHRYLLPDVCLSGGRFLDGTAAGRPAPPGRGRGHRRRRPRPRWADAVA